MDEKSFVLSAAFIVLVTVGVVSWRVNYIDDAGGSLLGSLSGGKALAAQGDNRCPQGMVPIPAGPFRYGSTKTELKDAYNMCRTNVGNCYPHWFVSEFPAVNRELPFFCIDQFEAPPKLKQKPQAAVNFAAAQGSCEARGARLCTEYEWEKACRGPAGNLWTYGNRHQEKVCQVNEEEPLASGERAQCRSGYNVYDMSGNLAEWTLSYYTEFDEKKEGRKREGDELDRVVRGGSYYHTASFSRCAARDHFAADRNDEFLGYRCCISGEEIYDAARPNGE